MVPQLAISVGNPVSRGVKIYSYELEIRLKVKDMTTTIREPLD